MRADLPWRLTGAALFGAACAMTSFRSPAIGSDAAIETGRSLFGFLLALAGVMLLISGRRWLDRMGSGGPTPIVRARARRNRGR